MRCADHSPALDAQACCLLGMLENDGGDRWDIEGGVHTFPPIMVEERINQTGSANTGLPRSGCPRSLSDLNDADALQAES